MRWLLALLTLVAWTPAHAATPSEAMAACAAYDANTYEPGTVQCIDVGAQHVTTNCQTYAPRTDGQGQVCGKRTDQFNQPDGYVTFGYTMPVCTSPATYSTVTHQCETPCDLREDQNFSYGGLGVQVHDRYCHSGCEWTVYGLDGSFTSAAAVGSQCATMEDIGCLSGESLITTSGGIEVCRPTDSDGDGTPDNSDDFPNDPTESTDSDGDGIGDSGDHKPDDPTNGKDEDEEGGDEGDNVSTGGGDCNTAPNSSGDGILTQIAYQTWKTRCAIERSQAADGSINVKGAGGSIAIAGGGGTDLGLGDATAEELGNPGNGGEHPGVASLFEDSDLNATIAAGPSEAGIGSFARTCPLLELPNLEMSFGTAVLPWSAMCGWLEMLAGIIVLAGTIQWAMIIGSMGT